MICLDASVVGMLISPDEKSDKILALYEKGLLKQESFVAPTLLPYEIASLLRKKQLKKLLTSAEVLGALHFFERLNIKYIEMPEMMERCLALCDILGERLTVYDASYLAIAEKYKAALWTADKILFETASLSFSNLELIQ